MPYLPEKNESLWMLTIGPVVWAVHFLLSYLTAALWCAKVAGRDGPLGSARTAIAVYTAIALAGIGVAAWKAFQRHTFGHTMAPHDFDSPTDRHRFLGFITFLLAGVSAVGVLFEALTILFIDTCH